MPQQTDVAVIGAGFSGIGMGMRLKHAGRHDFVILEKDGDLGGTWRDNAYPGCACDVPSSLYSFSFEPNPDWTRMFSPRDEIWAYLRGCVTKHRLEPHIRYQSEVTGARFDGSSGLWLVEVNHADVVSAKVLVAGVGALHIPKIPALPGLESFAGTTFHSAHWRHDHNLSGRNVAVLGTGASAVQFVPKIAPHVKRLDLYQRSPAWIVPRPDRPISEREQRLYARLPVAQRASRALLYWLLEARGSGFTVTPKAMKLLERSARRQLTRQVADLELRSKLEPDYQIGCKRVLLSSDFYPALTRDNVQLITDGISHVLPHGIVDGVGVERKVDTVIFGTGFQAARNLTRLNIVGLGDRQLDDVWAHRGIGAHLGMTVFGFPNLFLLLGPNTGLGHTSVVFMIESQIGYVLQALDLLDAARARYVDVRPDVERAFLDRLRRRLSKSVWQSGCTSWYLDEHGRNFAIWPQGSWRYWLSTRRLRPADFRVVTTSASHRQTAA